MLMSTLAWSSVSSKGKERTKSCTNSSSARQDARFSSERLASNSINSAAKSKSPRSTRSLRLRKAVPPILSSVTGRRTRADVALDNVDAAGGHEQAHVARVAQVQVLLFAACTFHAFEPHEACQAVHRVHHQVARLELEEGLDRTDTVGCPVPRRARGAAMRPAP